LWIADSRGETISADNLQIRNPNPRSPFRNPKINPQSAIRNPQ
jgi:hypothetical protein